MNETELDQLLDQWEAPVPSAALRSSLRAAFPQRPHGRLFGLQARWIVSFVAAAGALAVGTSFSGSIGQSEGCADLPTGRLCVHTTSFVDPTAAILYWWWKGIGASVGQTPDGTLKGYAEIEDKSAHAFYGYEYLVEPLDHQYKITISPLKTDSISKGSFVMTGRPEPLPRVPAPQIVSEGQPIDIDVYRSRVERLYIRFEVSAKSFGKTANATPPASQANRLRMVNSRVYKNGVLVGSEGGEVWGASIYLRLPGEGRYLITLDPTGNPAFVAAGQVNGGALEFQSGNVTYRLESDQPFALGSPRPIYVFHDAAFESQLKAGPSGLMVGSAGPACVFNGACLPR